MYNSVSELMRLGAFWQYKSSNKKYHVTLTSGLHSDIYCNLSKVIENKQRLEIIQASPNYTKLVDLVGLLYKRVEIDNYSVCFCGQAMGSIPWAETLGGLFSIPVIHAEKIGDVMEVSRYNLENIDNIIVVEDVMSTGGTTKKTIEAVGDKIAAVVTIVDRRSNIGELDIGNSVTVPVISLGYVFGSFYPEDNCPMCNEGSQVLYPPKETHNWKKLRNSIVESCSNEGL